MNTHLMPPESEMQAAYLARDASYDGLFFLGVRTTGVFCRPTCPARKPLPSNVEYFPTAREAVEAGYRACLRCRPLAINDEPAWAAELMAELEENPTSRITDEDLKARGVDPGTVRRHFLRRYGMTFQALARARRMSAALDGMRGSGTLDDAVFESGYGSHSGFREAFARIFGEPPGRYRQGACVRVAWAASPLGPIVTGATEEGICLVEFSDGRRLEGELAELKRVFDLPVVPGTNGHLDKLKQELAGYFEGKLRDFSVPLVYPGTPFQRRVWERLLEIPYGQTRSYEEIAAAAGNERAVRAIGTANGRNRVAIVIPCHRVVNKSGRLGGYGGGLWRKRYLLQHERSHRPRTTAKAP